MNINFKFLLLGTTLSLIPNVLYAQCAETDCLKLGYTSLQKCDNGLKCPFGEYWACPQKQCDNSYQYTCTGTNEQAGTEKCGDKYKSCNCASGYEWKDGKCKEKLKPILGQCTGYAKNCKIGQILNSDGTCTTNKVSSKTPIGVVIYISSDRKCGQAIALDFINKNKWSSSLDDISVLPNYRTVGDAISDYDSCGNTQKITQKGAADIYPAAWAAVDYAPSAAPETKGKWCLPAAGIWNSAFINFDIITSTLAIIRAKPLMQNYWGSSEHDYGFAWEFCTDIDACSKGIGFSAKKISQHIRPVIEF